MKVEYVTDMIYSNIFDRIDLIGLPQCPSCKQYPTYDMPECPYCGVELEYESKEDE